MKRCKMVLAEPQGGGHVRRRFAVGARPGSAGPHVGAAPHRRWGHSNRRFLYPTRDHSPASIHSSHLEEGVE